MKPYLLIVWNDIEPEIKGPFADEDERVNFAKGFRETDPEKDHGLYKVDASGRVEIDTFSGDEAV